MKAEPAKKVRAAILVLLTLAAGGVGAERLGRNGDGGCLVHEAGRVCLNLPENGNLGMARFNEERVGILWPGAKGREFLGSGGMYLRFLVEGENAFDLIGPGSFEPAGTGLGERKLHEGCEGGKRYPSRDCDDDGDGKIDEDSYDGIDNDGDGLVDEDFAAIGNEMIVTRAVEASMGLVLNQCSYAWSYGHVRDFIGFTTTIGYPGGRGGAAPDILNLDAALYMDFKIGDSGDVRRGEDDRFFFVRGTDRGSPDKTGRDFIAASGGASRGAFVAVVVLNSRGPDGAQLGVEGYIVRAVDDGEEIWKVRAANRKPGGRPPGLTIIHGTKGGEGASGGNVYGPPEKGRDYVEKESRGDFAVVHLLETIPRLKRGERFDIEWALVFGASEEILIRNARRALETYRGIENDPAGACRWIVPARKALRRECDVKLVAVWAHERKQPAAAVVLPPDLETEEVEWVRMGGSRTTQYERAGAGILLTLNRELVEREEPFDIEGQLTDGTIFTAKLGRELLRTYNMDDDLPPGRLPDDCMQLFPNPFLTSLNIDILVRKPSPVLNGKSRVDAEGMSSVRIYDVKGRLVRTILEEEFLHPGNYQASWDGLDVYGAEVAPGVYYCKLQIGARSLTKRVILLK